MKNLVAEMARYGVSNSDIQKVLNCSGRTIQNKISECSEFSVTEALKIREAFFPGMRISYLFRPDTAVEHVREAAE